MTHNEQVLKDFLGEYMDVDLVDAVFDIVAKIQKEAYDAGYHDGEDEGIAYGQGAGMMLGMIL